jgi:plasmid stability protein
VSQLIVRNLDTRLVKALKERAARHGRSAEAEHREILKAALQHEDGESSFKDLLATMPDLGDDDDFIVPRDLPRTV